MKVRVINSDAPHIAHKRDEQMRRARNAQFYRDNAWNGEHQQVWRTLVREQVAAARNYNHQLVRARRPVHAWPGED